MGRSPETILDKGLKRFTATVACVFHRLGVLAHSAWSAVPFMHWRTGLVISLALLTGWMCLWLSGDIGVAEIRVRDRSANLYTAGSGDGKVFLGYVTGADASARSFVRFTPFPAGWVDTFLHIWGVYDDGEPFIAGNEKWSDGSVMWVGLPHWVIAIPLSIWPGLAFCGGVRRYRRSRSGLCVACGYDLRASEDRCPECGEPFGADRNPLERRESRRRVQCYEHALLFAVAAWGYVLFWVFYPSGWVDVYLGPLSPAEWAKIPALAAITAAIGAHLCGVRGCWLKRLTIASGIVAWMAWTAVQMQ